MVDIKSVVDNLLKEKINMVFGDSGGAYGYIYEKNREEGYLKGLTPVDEYTNEEYKERTLEITIPVYDFLTYNLVKDDSCIGLEKQLFDELKVFDVNPYHIFEVADFLNNGMFTAMDIENEVNYVNTYNYDEYVSQTLQYALITDGCDWYVLLQVHNGCDVRSGYTFPQLFGVKDRDYFVAGLFDRKCECDCGLNDYTFYGSDEPTEYGGSYVYKDEVYNRTYVDDDGNVRCRDCDSVIKGGFIKW